MSFIVEWLASQQERRRASRPLVTLAYAQSLDGCLTLRRGQSLPLSGTPAMTLTHALRAAHAGILVGVGTILADNPLLTVRLSAGANPLPVVVDTHLRTPPQARLFAGGRAAWVACGPQPDSQRAAALRAAGAQILALPLGANGRVSLPALLDCLGEQGLVSLMVEGGAGILTSFLSQRLADLAVVTLAPVFVGGLHVAEQALSGPGPEDGLGRFPGLSDWQSERVGDNLLVWGACR